MPVFSLAAPSSVSSACASAASKSRRSRRGDLTPEDPTPHTTFPRDIIAATYDPDGRRLVFIDGAAGDSTRRLVTANLPAGDAGEIRSVLELPASQAAMTSLVHVTGDTYYLVRTFLDQGIEVRSFEIRDQGRTVAFLGAETLPGLAIDDAVATTDGVLLPVTSVRNGPHDVVLVPPPPAAEGGPSDL